MYKCEWKSQSRSSIKVLKLANTHQDSTESPTICR